MKFDILWDLDIAGNRVCTYMYDNQEAEEEKEAAQVKEQAWLVQVCPLWCVSRALSCVSLSQPTW